jgi:hypothetical protein
MVFLINIFAGVFGVVTARNRHAGGDPLPPPVLPNEAICNVEEIVFMWHGDKQLRRLQKNDKWLRFRNAHAQSHYPAGLETTRGGLAPS